MVIFVLFTLLRFLEIHLLHLWTKILKCGLTSRIVRLTIHHRKSGEFGLDRLRPGRQVPHEKKSVLSHRRVVDVELRVAEDQPEVRPADFRQPEGLDLVRPVVADVCNEADDRS